MLQSVEGVILNEKDYGETSKILNVITRDYGIIGVMSKGCKTMKSPLRSVSLKLTYGYFNIYYKQDKLSTLVSVDVIDSFRTIKTDIDKISYASFLLELTEQVVKQNNDMNIYDIFIEGLTKINQGFDPLVIVNILELKYLDYLGVMPIIDSCAICGSINSITTISSNKGGYLCKNCHTNEAIVSEKTIKLIRMFYYVDVSKISKLDISEVAKKEINDFLNNYYDQYTGLYLKSKSFINNLGKVGWFDLKKKGIYILNFLILLSIISIIFACKKIFPFGNNSVIWADMHNQITAFYYHLYDCVYNDSSLLINFNTAGGINFWGIMAYYIISPFSLIILLFKRSDIYLVVSIVVALKFIMCGMTSLYFIRYYFKKIPNCFAILLSLSYAFCGYNLIMYQITPWIDIVYLFPLLMIGLKKLLDLERPYLYMAILTISLIVSFYLSFILLIYIFIVSLIYLNIYSNKENKKKAITSLGIATVFSLIMASVIIIPTALQLFNSSRLGVSISDILNSKYGPVYAKMSFFLTSGFLAAVVLKLFKKIKSIKYEKNTLFLLITLILLVIPVMAEPVNKIWHMGSYICFPLRFGFIPNFIMIVCAGYYFNNLKEEKSSSINKFISLIVTIISSISIIIITIKHMDLIQRVIETLYLDDSKTAVLYLVIMFLITLFNTSVVMILNKNNSSFTKILYSIIIITSIITNMFIYVGMDFKMNELMDNYEKMNKIASTYKNNDNFRIKNLYPYLIRNYGMVTKYHTLDHFTSLTTKSSMDASKRLGYSSLWMDTSSEGGTIFTDMILANKYILTDKEIDSKYYKYKTSFDNLNFYESTLNMSYGYLVNYSDWVIETDNAFFANNNIYKAITDTNKDLITVYSNFSLRNIDIDVKEDTIKYKKIGRNKQSIIEQEIYVDKDSILYLDILRSLDNGENIGIRDTMNIYVNDELLIENHTSKTRNGLVNLGTFEKEVVNVKIELLKTIELSTLEIGKLDLELFEDFMNQYKTNTKVVFDKSKIYVDVYSEEEKILFLPIAYDLGYRAIINGKEKDVIKLFDNYIGIKLDKGDNDITISYKSPNLNLGITISLVSLMITIIIFKFKIYEFIIHNGIFVNIIYSIYFIAFVGVFVLMYVLALFKFITSIL